MIPPWSDELAKEIQAAKDERKAKAESLIQLFVGLGIILFLVPLCVFFSWCCFRGEPSLLGGWFFGIGAAMLLWDGIERIITPISAVGERGNANRSALMIIGFFLLILVVIVFGTILVIKK